MVEADEMHTEASILSTSNSDSLQESQDETKAKITIPASSVETTKINQNQGEKYKSQFNTNLERFHFICKDLPSPNLFIDFDFYFMIAASLNRKVWIGDEGELFRIYPNLYLIFIAAPGVGKSLPASAAHRLLDSLTETKLDKKTNQYYVTKLLNLGPDAITFEKLVLRAHASSEVIKAANGKHYHHSSTTFCLADEMGMLFNDNTRRVVLFLNKAWDCHDYAGDTIKHGEVLIKNICCNFLGCAPPDTMGELMRTKVLNDGFTARTLFLFSNDKREEATIIKNTKEQMEEGKIIQSHLRKLATLPPVEVKYSPEAYSWLDDWRRTKQRLVHNKHPKLADFYGRKKVHLTKLAMNIHFAENINPVMDVKSFVEAEKLLKVAEENMHLALGGAGENPSFKIAELIKKYLVEHGPTTRSKLLINFYDDADTTKLVEIMDYLINTEQCNAVTVKGKSAISLNNK